MGPFFTGLVKLVTASLLAGAALNFFGLSADSLLARIGLTPAEAWDLTLRFIAWAVPNMLLGAIVILPLWFFTYLFIPPRGGVDD
ncbi:DUF6460 domain-containing protein [Rhizobium alvei]|uniref:DUF6460 domain-containing protein n=1 Tax=Rhizobium alvei TaxID=1132659 RepID=A0ABT8YGU1_9HYPH|nr:DUF6460 domain-containing protein [Rhizobium alvei]MDO6962617.1 DUF6460 domain-containing protein [Rhizobium alvei]